MIPVEDKIALNWRQTPSNQRAEIIRFFSWIVERSKKTEMTSSDFIKLMDGLSAKAIANGLTPEILAEILDED